METIRTEHLSEAEIEDCAGSRLQRSSAPDVLDHLMICDHCSDLLEQEIDLRRDFRQAAELAASIQTAPAPAPKRWSFMHLFPVPAIAAAALGAFLLLGPTLQRGDAPMQTIDLAAYRGAVNTTAKAGAPLELRLDASGLESGGPIELRVVDLSGKEIWRSSPQVAGSQVVERIDRKLDPGVYWVRLSRAGEQNPVREFRLKVQ